VTIRVALLATAGLFFVVTMPAPGAATPMAIELAAKLFAARPSASAPDLSPDGDKIVYIEALEGPANAVAVLDLKTKQTTEIIGSAGKPDSILWCEFASENWVVCQVHGDIPFRASIVGSSRLIAINLTTKKVRNLGVESNVEDAATIRQNDGYVIGYPTDGPASVVMARNYVMRKGQEGLMGSDAPPVALGVDRIALDTMKVTRIEAPSPLVEELLTEPNGRPRVETTSQYSGLGQMTGISTIRFRAAGSDNWMDLSTFDSRTRSGMAPLMVDAASNEVYLMRKKDGREALYRQKLEPNAQPVEVASNPYYDIDGVVRLARDGPVIGYAYTGDRPEVVYFDPSYKKLVDDLGKVLTDESMIELSASSRDGIKVLIHAASERDPGAYYVFNRETRNLDFALEDRDNLANVTLAPVRRVDVPTADGHSIPAYLTMSQGRTPNGPAIVLPHGGPSARDALGFDWLAQFLAARGYAVIQPNYRGSAGYGDQFLGENAFKNWRTAIGDIGASADYLVKQGISDPARLAIVGWSYGGYAALQSAVTTPGKYKAVVAIAPVTDLSRLGRDDEDFVSADLTKDFLGKSQNLRDGSPLQHAKLIKAPVLLVHGDLDRNVRVWHSQRMEKALRSAGGSVELLEFKGLNHQLSNSDARTQMLTKVAELLDRTIGH
jgi:acetyl esterase/lipase